MEIPIEHHVFLPPRTLAKIARIDELIDQVADRRWPEGATDRAERRAARQRRPAVRRARRACFDVLLQQLLQRASTPEQADQLFRQMVARGYSRTPRTGAQKTMFVTDRQLWTQWSRRFERFTGRGHRGTKGPDYVMFTYLLEGLDDDILQAVVRDGTGRVPELAEVSGCAPVPVASPSSL